MNIMHTRPQHLKKVTSYKTVHKVTTLQSAAKKKPVGYYAN